MFCSSPSVIPTHTPGTDGPSRATHLCVSLVAHSASYFSVDALKDPVRMVALSITITLLWAMACWSSMSVWIPALTENVAALYFCVSLDLSSTVDFIGNRLYS